MAKCWIVVADSGRARIFEGDTRARTLDERADLVHPESRARDRELTSDREGRAFDSVGRGRHHLAPQVSRHDHEADEFARTLVENLRAGLGRGAFKRWRLAAPPAFLGRVRKHLDAKLDAALEETLDKNLVKATNDDIAAHFFASGGRSRATD